MATRSHSNCNFESWPASKPKLREFKNKLYYVTVYVCVCVYMSIYKVTYNCIYSEAKSRRGTTGQKLQCKQTVTMLRLIRQLKWKHILKVTQSQRNVQLGKLCKSCSYYNTGFFKTYSVAFALLAVYRNLYQNSPFEFHFSDVDGVITFWFVPDIGINPRVPIQCRCRTIITCMLTSIHSIKLHMYMFS